MVLLFVALSCGVLVLIFNSWRRRQSHKVPKKRVGTKPTNPYHAVSIVPEHHCCRAAKELGNKRFLSYEAPVLPLEKCDAAKCQCRYQHFDDRRRPDSNRRLDYGITQELYGAFGEENRRERPAGRRKTDKRSAI